MLPPLISCWCHAVEPKQLKNVCEKIISSKEGREWRHHYVDSSPPVNEHMDS